MKVKWHKLKIPNFPKLMKSNKLKREILKQQIKSKLSQKYRKLKNLKIYLKINEF